MKTESDIISKGSFRQGYIIAMFTCFVFIISTIGNCFNQQSSDKSAKALLNNIDTLKQLQRQQVYLIDSFLEKLDTSHKKQQVLNVKDSFLRPAVVSP